MSVPKSVVKIKKQGVEYVESVEKANYFIDELTRAALRDVGKFVSKRTRQQIHRRTGRLAKIYNTGCGGKIQICRSGLSRAGGMDSFRKSGRKSNPK